MAEPRQPTPKIREPTSSPQSICGTPSDHDETNHVPLRSADCERGHRAAPPLRHHLDPQPAAGHGTTVREGNRAWRARSPRRSASTSSTTRACSNLLVSSCAASTWSSGSRSRVLKDYVIDFPEFREITFFGAGGRVIATSRVGESHPLDPDAATVGSDDVSIAPLAARRRRTCRARRSPSASRRSGRSRSGLSAR